MERETRIRQQENSVGGGAQQQQQTQPQQGDFGLRRNLHTATVGSTMNTSSSATSELSSNTVDPFLSAAASVHSTQSPTITVPSSAAAAPSGAVATSAPAPTPPSSLATDFHARQESADSGLGMGGSYSLPHTPEDFLASMDDTMDTTLDCKTLCSGFASSILNHSFLGPPSVGTVDMNAGLENNDLPTNAMDTTDDLVPTLDVRHQPSHLLLHTHDFFYPFFSWAKSCRLIYWTMSCLILTKSITFSPGSEMKTKDRNESLERS